MGCRFESYLRSHPSFWLFSVCRVVELFSIVSLHLANKSKGWRYPTVSFRSFRVESGRRLAIPADGSRFNHGPVKNTTPATSLSQLKIIENRWIAERDQDRASCLRRMGTVNGIWLDIEFCALRIRDAFAYEVTVKDVGHFGCSLVQVSWNFAPWLHSQ